MQRKKTVKTRLQKLKCKSFLGGIFAVLFFILITNTAYSCVNIGTFGATFEIKEKDALDQIISGLKHRDWRKFFNKKRFVSAFQRYENRLSTDLPLSKKHKIYKVNMSYTLDRNIIDAKGNVIYPKGYTFNPLDYIRVPFVYVIIDGSDRKQVKWFLKSKYYNKIKAMILICKGDVLTLEKKIKLPVFYADKRIIKRFDIKTVPSIAYQKGDTFYVEEIPVCDNSSSISNSIKSVK